VAKKKSLRKFVRAQRCLSPIRGILGSQFRASCSDLQWLQTQKHLWLMNSLKHQVT